MEVQDLLDELYKQEVVLYLENGKLKIKIPKNKSIDNYVEIIKLKKDEIIEILSSIHYEKQSLVRTKEKKDYYRLTSAQQRLYLLQEMEQESTAYNMPYVIPLGSESDKNKIEEIFLQLIKRHESFRTSFEIIGEEPIQRIQEQVEFKLEELEITKEEIQEKRQQFIQAFDLSKAPLLRVSKVDIKGESSLLMIDMHHIISDGVSHSILEEDFRRLYSGEELAPLSLQYKDYSQWQNSEEQQLKVKKQENYWISKFEGEIPVLNLPIDKVRPVIQSHEGATVSFTLSKEETHHIKSLAKENDLTLYMSVLSVFSILLSKLGGQEEIIVGAPIAGRNHSDLENIVGMFVNTLAIRNEVNGSNTLKEFLRKLKQSTLEAYENQDYQFEDLVDKVSVERDISRNPLFDVMFNLLNHAEYSEDISDLSNDHYAHTSGISKFDLSLTAVDYGDQLLCNLTYCTSLFKPESIERFIAYFKQIINQLPGNTESKLSSLDILSTEEKQLLLHEFNDTTINYPRNKTIHQLFEEQVERSSDGIALVFNDQVITYKELNLRSNRLAQLLLSKGLKTEDIVGILLDRSIEMIIGVLGILKAGCTYLPMDIESPKERINYIIKESKPKVILSQNSIYHDFELEEECLDLFETSIYLNNQAQNISQGKASDSAYIIYTSGSTGKPKGVIVEHGNVVNLINGLTTSIYSNYQETLHISLISPLYFDASVKQIFPSLTLGHSLNIIPESIRFEGAKLVNHYTKHDIRIADGTPFHAQMLAQHIEVKTQGLNIRQFVLGGDELKLELMQSLFQKIDVKELKISNVYGPTECTDVTTIKTSTIESLKDKGNTSIGKPISNYEIFILGKNLELLPIGVPGELCISGAGVSRGYLYNEELTSEKFIEHPYKNGERLYKTGDLARWLPDGDIEFLGRIDHQVKIRGYRIELGEIENVLLRHESIKESVVLAIQENGDKYLCAYFVAKEDLNQEEIRAYLSASLPDYMIPSYFVQLEKLPITSNGKINRKALPSPEIKAGDDYVAPLNATEEKLVGIWSAVLNIAKEEISTKANFFSIGGHSLKASVLTRRIHKETGVEFPLRDVFLYSTVRDQACQINTRDKKDFVSIPKAKKQEYYALSSAQKRLYLLQQMDLESTAYNMPYIIPLGSEVKKEKIEDAFRQLLKRHESFRTSFEIEGEEPVQRIYEQVEFKIEELTITKEEVQNQRQQFIQAFDLSQAPLLRVSKVDIKGESSLLMIDMHHIISDGVSHAILEQDFQKLYSGEDLAPLNLQYKDYSQWQNSEEQKIKVKEQENYWIDKFKEEIPVLNLPTDYVRPIMQSTDGATVSFALNKEKTQQIKTHAKENGLTLYMSVLSVFNILLSKLSRQEDIIVGTPIAGRNHSDLENIVGMFVNTLAIRNEVKGSNTLNEFTRKLKQTTLEAFENQDCQFEELVEKVPVVRDTSRNPLFDVMFDLIIKGESTGDLKEDISTEINHTPGISKFDLTITAIDYGEQLLISIEYCTKLFKASTIDRYKKYFKALLNQISGNSGIYISEIDIVGAAEKQQLLYEFNDTREDYPIDKTIHEIFEEQVERTPNKIAIINGNECITYKELNKKANQLAGYCRSNGVVRESKIGLLTDHSLVMMIGMLGILKSGGCYVPIDITYPEERINFIIEDAEIDIILFSNIDLSTTIQVGIHIDIEKSNVYQEIKTNIENINNPSDLSYIIYTSGSTGKPKGVMVEHRNVVSYIYAFQKEFCLNSRDNVMQQASISFDTFVEEVYPIITIGGKVTIIEKENILDLDNLGRLIKNNNITVISCSPLLLNEINTFPYNLLREVRLFISGGDELKYSYINNLIEYSNIYNTYGPTEATVCSLYYKCEKDNNEKIPIGSPVANDCVYILDEKLKLLPIGVAGELCIGGAGLSRGYLNNKKLTSEKFTEHPFKEGERLYKTGDLARWLPDGNVEFLGRIDHQVKIRGFRIELGEIENLLQKHGQIKESVVLAREENGDKYLCAYIVAAKEFNQEEIHTHLSASLPDYMIPSYFIALGEIPLTPNGKVNRKALPSPEIKAGDDYVAPSNAIEEKLVEIWSEVLKIEKEEISTIANFFSIGGHSLKASVLTGRIHKETGVEFPLRDVFLHTNIQAQASQINTRDKKDFVSITKAKVQEYYPLSSAQKRLYLLQEMELESTAYNMPYIIPLGIKAEKEKIEEVFLQLIKRHESFRTSFEIEGEEPVQRIHEEVEFKLEEFTITKEEVQNQRHQFIQAFDLSKAPLLRVAKVDVQGESSLLMIDMHHIISDGVSHAILEQDFQRLYVGEKLAPLSLQYKDYSEWQNSEEQQAKVKKQEDYWIEKFEEEIPVLNLPLDYVRPAIQSHEGARVSFSLSKEETQHIKLLAKENELTLYMSVLSVFNILLSKLSGQEDIILGTPIAGRNHRDLENIVGMFVNTLAIRNEVNGSNSLKDFTKKVKQNTLEAFENQDYQFEELVENISIERDISRNPVFDVMFNLLNQTEHNADLTGLANQNYVHKSGISKFDLTLTAVDYGDQLMLSIEYCTKLFKAETIERFIRYFKQIVTQISLNPEKELSEIGIISTEEKQQILYEFNDTQVSYPSQKSIPQVFDEQVKEFSKKIALEDKDKSYTYQELDEESNKIANYLIKCGVKEDQLIGLMASRASEMIIGILGILKTGGAYVPIDPDYPQERVNQLIEDSGINILLSTEQVDFEYNLSGGIIKISDFEIKESSTNLSLPTIRSSNIAYVMYTSGSTGTPKGVVIEQKSVLRLVQNNQFFPFHSEQKILLTGAPVFDATTFEIWGALLNGGSLYIASNEEIINSGLLGECIRKNSITSLWLTSSLFNQLVDQDESIFDTLKFLLVGGDVLSVKHINKVRRRKKDLIIINGYGPTENTTFSTTFNIDKEYEGNIPIGKPISNSTAYIFDRSNKLQAVGVPGELLVGGEGLAREYLNNSELTQDKFIENPYKPGERLYKTGDLVRLLPDGNIEFLGRIDHQVKIRGFRIELGEIENVLQKHENIKECLVIAREKEGDKYLCAYIVCKKEENNHEKIRAYLSANLPDYMIPSYFVVMDKIPLTPNGKVNRKALPSPEIKAGDGYVAPSNEIEEKLAEIWSEVLNIEKEEISTTANFFSIGGHSLKAATCINKLMNKFDINIPLLEIFKNPTIYQLAEYIHVNKSKTGINDDHLVLLKEGAVNGENIFLIHDGSGEVDGYIEFCKQATDGINFWGIKAGSLKKYEPTNITIKQLAIKYIKCLKKVQKQGEYNIAGWSLGGTIAFEMVRQLEQEQEKVRFFGIIDSRPPNVNEEAKIKEFTVETELDWIRNYIKDEEIIVELSLKNDLKELWIDMLGYLKNLSEAEEIIKLEIVKNIGFEIKDYKNISIEELVKFMNFTRSLNTACNYYKPENIVNTQISYYIASESKINLYKNWNIFAKKDMNIKIVEGSHFSIFAQPKVKDFYKNFIKSYKNIEKKTLV